MPTLWECIQCEHSIAFKQPSCGWCGLVLSWDNGEKEYKHIEN